MPSIPIPLLLPPPALQSYAIEAEPSTEMIILGVAQIVVLLVVAAVAVGLIIRLLLDDRKDRLTSFAKEQPAVSRPSLPKEKPAVSRLSLAKERPAVSRRSDRR